MLQCKCLRGEGKNQCLELEGERKYGMPEWGLGRYQINAISTHQENELLWFWN